MSDVRLSPVLRGFVRVGLQKTLAYRVEHWARLVNAAVKVGTIVVVWQTLYSAAPDRFPVGRAEMITYAVLGMMLSEVFDWWNGPHYYLSERIREGTITGDLLRPVSLPVQLFAIWLGETVGTVVTVSIPVMIVTILVTDIAGPAGAVAGGSFVVSLVMSYTVLFCCSFLVGMIVLKTLNLLGIMHVYHAVLTLFTGFWIPLWFFPGPLLAVANVLPFKAIFFTPLAIYVGYLHGTDLLWALTQQAGWLVVGLLAVRWAWSAMRRRLVVQGG